MKKKKTLEDITTLEPGDIISEMKGRRRTYREVLEVGNKTILVSYEYTSLEQALEASAMTWFKPSVLISDGYKIYQPEEDTKTKERIASIKHFLITKVSESGGTTTITVEAQIKTLQEELEGLKGKE